MKFIVRIVTFLMMFSLPAVSQDFEKGWAALQGGEYGAALKELRPLAENGYAGAQFILGLMYDEGQGVPQDYAEAATWYRMAAEQGYVTAQSKLGFMYDEGQGVPQDYNEAIKWFMLAAAQGNVYAQHNLGVAFLHGKGVLQDYLMAHMWFNIAATNGNKLAETLRKALTTQMTLPSLEKAQTMANKCIGTSYSECQY